jgi:hypothetical protein
MQLHDPLAKAAGVKDRAPAGDRAGAIAKSPGGVLSQLMLKASVSVSLGPAEMSSAHVAVYLPVFLLTVTVALVTVKDTGSFTARQQVAAAGKIPSKVLSN